VIWDTIERRQGKENGSVGPRRSTNASLDPNSDFHSALFVPAPTSLSPDTAQIRYRTCTGLRNAALAEAIASSERVSRVSFADTVTVSPVDLLCYRPRTSPSPRPTDPPLPPSSGPITMPEPSQRSTPVITVIPSWTICRNGEIRAPRRYAYEASFLPVAS